MATEKIDVHKSRHNYEKELARLHREEKICAANKQIIFDFLNACQLGKTIIGREKKKLGEKRLVKYLYALRRINEWLGNKNFRDIAQVDMEAFISCVERNALCVGGRAHTYTEWTRRDIKVCVKKFYKWLLGGGLQYPALVSWIDTHIKEDAPESLSMKEVRKLAEHAPSREMKALVWCLFETRARVSHEIIVRIYQQYLYLKTKLMALYTWPVGGNRIIEQRRLTLEGILDVLKREGRNEEVKCTEEIARLKSELWRWLKEYLELAQRVRLVLDGGGGQTQRRYT